MAQNGKEKAQFPGEKKSRNIKGGRGKEYSGPFNHLRDTKFYFVQFAVYPSTTDPNVLGAPPSNIIGQTWIIRHEDTKVQTISRRGGIYIVKAFTQKEEAMRCAKKFNSSGIECFYNKDLDGIQFDLIAFTNDCMNC